ncbi:TIGR00730 family Rossman fold protein [Nitrospinota bacterium]
MDPQFRPSNDEHVFLEGPTSRKSEWAFLFRMARDLLRGFRVFRLMGPCITVFGSARIGEDHPYYELSRRAGRSLAELGFTVMTGGGPGLMEAANRGAKEAGGRSVGCNIDLPFEQEPNPYLDRWVTINYFFIRKVFLFKYSYGFIGLPGGAGTMDEIFEAVTLIQTKKIANFPIVLMGEKYWGPLIVLLKQMAEEGTISESDLGLFLVTDSVEEAIAHIDARAVKTFRLKRVKSRVLDSTLAGR